jgi:hypothetical protein
VETTRRTSPSTSGNGLGACDRYDSGVLLRGDGTPHQRRRVQRHDVRMEEFPPVPAVCRASRDGHIQQAGLVFNDEDWDWDVYHGPVGETTIDFIAWQSTSSGISGPEPQRVRRRDHGAGRRRRDRGDPAADIAAANALLGSTASRLPHPRPAPIVSPQAVCQAKQIKAGAKLCKAELSCEALAGGPGRRSDGAARDACASKAQTAFVAAWDGGSRGTLPPADATTSRRGADVAPVVRAASGEAIDLIGSGDA